jgi:UDP-GlcNAc:undecaprenyl-phosphate GlcNAc-1-phosphate transferase
MGDSGSYFLGYLLATASLTGSLQKASTAVSLLVPMVALGVPIFDTLFSIVRRTLERRPLFSADRGHVHHRLLDLGLTHRRAVIVLYGVSILLTVSAIAIALGRIWEIGIALLVVSVVLICLIRFVGYFEYARLRRPTLLRSYDRQTLALRPVVAKCAVEIAGAASVEQLWSQLSLFARGAHLALLELQVQGDAAPRCWHAEPEQPRSSNLLRSRFVLDAERCVVEFGWLSETESVSPECDILLQLVSDSVEAALRSMRPALEQAFAVAPRARVAAPLTTPTSQLSPSR